VAHDALELGPDLLIAEERRPELLRHRIVDPVAVPHDHRPVEPLCVLDRVDLLCGDVRVGPQPPQRSPETETNVKMRKLVAMRTGML
jgi:hypothetical protein